MNARHLTEPILDGGILSVNFFNGRLLSGEDLTKEHQAQEQERARLAKAIGEGIAFGLEVIEAVGSTRIAPVVTVKAGLAINALGYSLALPADTDISLVQPQGQGSAPPTLFSTCLPPQSGAYVAGAGMYLLTITPAAGSQGRAPVSGLGNTTASCNVNYNVEGVQFRLIQLDLTQDELNDQAHLRNHIAYKCFGTGDAGMIAIQENPFGPPLQSYGVVDALHPNRLTDCDVPLALLYWTADNGIEFLDLWPVRRRLIDPSVTDQWNVVLGDRRQGEAEAMFLQFQDHIAAILKQTRVIRPPIPFIPNAPGPRPGIIFPVIFRITPPADAHFEFLPAAGYLPTEPGGLDWRTFLGPMSPTNVTLVDEGLLRSIVFHSFFEDPIKVVSFTEAQQANQAPPVPVDVYQVPDQDFVVFARSSNGRIRIFLKSTDDTQPVQAVQIAASSSGGTQLNTNPETGIASPPSNTPPDMGNIPPPIDLPPILIRRLAATTFPILSFPPTTLPASSDTEKMFALDDVPPGIYTLQVTAQGFQEQSIDAVTVVGGRTTDVSTMLQPLPNGSILVNVTDQTNGNPINTLVGVKVTATQDNKSYDGILLPQSMRWLIDDLPSGTYTVTVTAAKYQVGTVPDVAVTRGQQVSLTVPLTPVPPQPDHPPTCIVIVNIVPAMLVLPSIRICMVLDAARFYPTAYIPPLGIKFSALAAQSGILQEAVSQPISEIRPVVAEENLRVASFHILEHGNLTVPIEKPGSLILYFPPWASMTRFDSLPDNVLQWLADWQSWFNNLYPGQGIDRATPAIFVNKDYTPPRDFASIPGDPQAYAVFGTFGVPLTINSLFHITKRPVLIDKSILLGLDDDVIHTLAGANIRYIDQLAGAWSGLIAGITNQSMENSGQLINDAVQAVTATNNSMSYYAGINQVITVNNQSTSVKQILANQGINDDVALANTSRDDLAKALGNQGFANRLIDQARQVVPPQDWSLDQLGFTPGQIDTLQKQGINSKGEFVAKIKASTTGGSEIATSLNIDTPTIAHFNTTALSQLAASSIARATVPEAVALLPGVNNVVARQLATANIITADDLAKADPATLAKTTSLSEAAVSDLKTQATNLSRANLDISTLAPLGTADVEALNKQNVHTVADLAALSTEKIATTFAGQPGLIALHEGVLKSLNPGIA